MDLWREAEKLLEELPPIIANAKVLEKKLIASSIAALHKRIARLQEELESIS